jgi:hypothetical protein
MRRQPTEATARALVLVASGRSVQEAATAAGIAVSTLTRAMVGPAIRPALGNRLRLACVVVPGTLQLSVRPSTPSRTLAVFQATIWAMREPRLAAGRKKAPGLAASGLVSCTNQ